MRKPARARFGALPFAPRTAKSGGFHHVNRVDPPVTAYLKLRGGRCEATTSSWVVGDSSGDILLAR
jgi:hypothetical protein